MWYRASIVTAFAGLLLAAGPVRAADRLNDEDVQKLLQSIEQKRSKFEGELDEKQKNTTLRGPRGEVRRPTRSSMICRIRSRERANASHVRLFRQ